MNFTCHQPDCSTSPTLYCNCNNHNTYSCPSHVLQHFESDETCKHAAMPMYKKVNPEAKQLEVENLKSLKESLEKSNEYTSEFLKRMIETLNSLLLNVTKYYEEVKIVVCEKLETAENKEKDLIVPGFADKVFHPDEFNAYLEKIPKLFTIILNDSVQGAIEIEKSLKGEQEFYDKIKTDELDFRSNANLDQSLYFFKAGTKVFIEVNIDDFTIKETLVNVLENQGSLAGICQIPDNKVFISGGYSPHLDSSYLIDLKNKSVEPLAKCRERSLSTATFINGCIYMFGGFNSKGLIQNSDKFIIESKTWTSIANMPVAQQDTSVLPCKSLLIISTHSANCLFAYILNSDTYETLATGIVSHSYNILMRNSGMCYLITGSNVFVCKENELNKWMKVEKTLNMGYCQNTSKPITRGRYAFFCSSHYGKVFRFGFDDFTLVEVILEVKKVE
ncbi:hypothetical protein SteCoe_32248 [Stentor coeruleus]|uniref:Uncharacterized protein n=1 Tax=Stentor coeruleus TaxID=5963 RepID=A0A1R2AZH2_9CILI|nr:hypothetical protein SteCoe_32248 [Stentor coeruleus]